MKLSILNFGLILVFTASFFFFYGCTTAKEKTRGFLGISTREIEASRKDAVSETFNCSYEVCYQNAKAGLADIGAYIYTEDAAKKLIAVYVSEEDTTPVGVFFSEAGPGRTKLEVSSPSTYANELVSKKLYSYLKKALEPKVEEGIADEQESMENK
ncbi:MAG: hypothetical protein AB1481_03085 [Candidatus Omnitrophota bacterium]